MLELVFYGYTVVGIFLIYFLCNIVQCVICACLSGLEESHPLATAIYCFWLFQANSLGHIFIIFYLCNVLLLL